MIALLLALITAVLCCACSGGGNTPTDDSDKSQNTQTQRPGGSFTEEQHPEDSSAEEQRPGSSSAETQQPDTDLPGKTVKLEKCESTGEVGFDKIDMGNNNTVYFTGNEAAVFPFKYDGKYGYINENGEIVIKNSYGEASPFSEGKALAGGSNGWDVIDTEGKILVSTEYQIGTTYFKNGYAISSAHVSAANNTWNFYIIDDDCNIKAYNMEQFEKVLWNLEPVVINTETFIGYMIKNASLSDTKVACKFYNVNDNLVSEFSTPVTKTPRIIGGQYSYLINDERKYCVANFATGASVTDYIFDAVGNFSDGVIPVCAYDKWGLIDTEGKELIKPKYAYLSAFSHGLGFALDFDGEGILINKSGGIVAVLPDEIFGGDDSLSVESFTDSGFVFVSNHNKKGFLINEKGEIIFSGDANSFKYISAGYVVYGGDLYKVVEE